MADDNSKTITISVSTAELDALGICIDIADPDQDEQPQEVTLARSVLSKMWNEYLPE